MAVQSITGKCVWVRGVPYRVLCNAWGNFGHYGTQYFAFIDTPISRLWCWLIFLTQKMFEEVAEIRYFTARLEAGAVLPKTSILYWLAFPMWSAQFYARKIEILIW